MSEGAHGGKGAETLHGEVLDLKRAAIEAQVNEVKEDLKEEVETRKNQCGHLFDRVEKLQETLTDHRVSTAKQLAAGTGGGLAGGATVAGLIEIIQWVLQSGGPV